ncbi:MAG: hypothetical protein JRI23_03985 [Deltaproteobacteria bacterium]|jgi:uncharacterized membrane protein YqiK|nr:hypothetical protein [Deltaproteobacteria bacterium]MBW2530689.1 hypothetical protein [Deltaproteobacteria bacterium]
MNHLHRSALASAGLALCVLAACNGKEGGQTTDQKKDYETAIAELKEPVATIAIYQPFLTEPDPGKYPPKRRSNVDEAMFQAANEIRHAANRARQVGARTGSVVANELTQPFLDVAKACAAPEEPAHVARCKKAVEKLDGELAKMAAKSMAAGVTTKFPRVASEHVTDKAKKAAEWYMKAKGPSETEKKYRATRVSDKAEVQELIMSCRAAEGEANTVMLTLEKKDETLHKLAAKHKIAVEAECNRLNFVANTHDEINNCREDPDKPAPKLSKEEKEEKEKKCKLACANGRKIVTDGIPAAAFKKLETDYKEVCEEDDDEKKDEKK